MKQVQKLNLKPVHSDFQAQRRYGNNRYICKSIKLGRRVYCFSLLEYYNFLMAEFNPEIIDYCEQPDMDVSSLVNGKIKRSRPDMVQLLKDGKKLMIECKPIKDLKKSKVETQILIQKEWSDIYNYEHHIFTEKDVGGLDIYISNLKFMHTTLGLIDEQTLSHYNILIKRIEELDKDTNEKIKIEYLVDNHPFINKGNHLELLSLLYYYGKIDMNLEDNFFNNESLVIFNG